MNHGYDSDLSEPRTVGLDWCPTCSRRIRDTDDNGCEAPWGQRYCLPHLPSTPPIGSRYPDAIAWLARMLGGDHMA